MTEPIDLDALERRLKGNHPPKEWYPLGEQEALALIAELRAARQALQRIVDEREHNPTADPTICDECSLPLPGHAEFCAASIARQALGQS